MLAPSPVVKKTAKTALSQRFLQSVAVCCVLVFTFFTVQLIASVASVFGGTVGYIAVACLFIFLVVMPLTLGVLYYFRRLLWEQKDSLLVIFKYFSSADLYKRALHISGLLLSRLLGFGAVLFSPCIIVWLLSNEQIYSMLNISLPIWTSNLWRLTHFWRL